MIFTVVERCLKTVSDQGACKNVSINRDFAPGCRQVMLDHDLCDQVFTNLIMNACEAMGEEGGELRVRYVLGGKSRSQAWWWRLKIAVREFRPE